MHNSNSYLGRFWRRLSARDGWNCHYCGVDLVPANIRKGDPAYYLPVRQHSICGDIKYHFPLKPNYKQPQVDHMIPRSWGGSDSLENLVLCCRDCNHEKSNKYSYEQFIELLASRGVCYQRK